MSAVEKVPSRTDGRALLGVLFGVYLVLLAWVVLWKLGAPFVGGGALRHVKLVPFLPAAGDGASTPVEVVANLALFVPFGLYLALLRPAWPWWTVAAVVAGASVLLEATQYVLAVGSSDVTDVLVNTAGGVAGFGLRAAARGRARSTAGAARLCLVGTVLGLLACGLFVASPVRYGPQPDRAGATSHPVPAGAVPGVRTSRSG